MPPRCYRSHAKKAGGSPGCSLVLISWRVCDTSTTKRRRRPGTKHLETAVSWFKTLVAEWVLRAKPGESKLAIPPGRAGPWPTAKPRIATRLDRTRATC